MPEKVAPLEASEKEETPADVARPAVESEYSIEKFLALQRYVETVSRWRVAWVIVTTPVYGLVCALLPSFVPLQDPLDPRGVLANPGYLLNTFLLCFVIYLGTFMHWRASTGLSDVVYTWSHVLIGTAVTATVTSAFALLLAVVWRFPIPMSWIVVSGVANTAMAAGHVVAFGKRCWRDKQLMDAVWRYVPALNFQTLQLVLYPAFSVLFGRVSTLYQVLLTVLFPALKHLMKRLLRTQTRGLKDFSTEVAVSGIEICAALYQSMIMQSAPSKVAMAIIMGVDVVQGIVVVKFFMDRQLDGVPQHLIVSSAFEELKQQQQQLPRTTDDQSKGDDGVHGVRPASFARWADARLIRAASRSRIRGSEEIMSTPATVDAASSETSTKVLPASPLVEQALSLVNVAESILLVEYLEVAIPLVNGIFVAISCQFSGAQYNTRLRSLYLHPESLRRAIFSIMLYAALQALSFVAMHLVMKHRYGLSAVKHLAFLLERHQASIVGKTLAWLPIILHFTGVHFGVDFSFKFDFAAMLRESHGSSTSP